MSDKNNVFFTQWMQAQKDMMDFWQKNIMPAGPAMGVPGMEWMQNWWNNMATAYMPDGGQFPFFKAPQDFGQPLKNSMNWSYQLYDLWQKLYMDKVEPGQEAWKDLLEQYQNKSMAFVQSNMMDFLPKEMQETFTHAQSLFGASTKALRDFFGPWMDAFLPMGKDIMQGSLQDPEAFLKAFNVWKTTYRETIGKFLNMPMMGITQETQEMQLQFLDRMITFITYYIELMVQISDVAKESMTKIFEETAKSIKTGKGPKTYEEFYDFWKNTLSSVFDNLFYSDEFSKLLAETVNAGMDMKILRNKNVEAYLKEWPIPVKSDMDSLYKKVHDLQKDVRDLQKLLADSEKTAAKDDSK